MEMFGACQMYRVESSELVSFRQLAGPLRSRLVDPKRFKSTPIAFEV